MLLPALNQARDKAYDTQCKNNLKQIGTAHTGYANDNGEWLTPGSWKVTWVEIFSGTQPTSTGSKSLYSSGYGITFPGAIPVKTGGTLYCPAAKGYVFGTSTSLPQFKYGFYSVNRGIFPVTGRTDYFGKLHKLSAITSPGIAVFTVDGAMPGYPLFTTCKNPMYRHGGEEPLERYTGSDNYVPTSLGWTNVQFGDGHVGILKYAELAKGSRVIEGVNKENGYLIQ